MSGTFWDAVKTGAILAGTGGGLVLAYNLGKNIYDDVHERRVKWRQDQITLDDLEQQRQLANVRTIQADAKGRYPLLYGVNGLIRDPNSLRAFTLDAVRETWPAIERLDAIARVVLAGGGWPAAPAQAQLLEAQAVPAVTLGPSTLAGLLDKYHFTPRLHRVLIGEYIDDDGQAHALTLDIPKSVHVLATGGSGLGKSTLLEAMALQLAGLEGVQLAAVDYGSGTFDGLESALHWQLADSPGLAIALFQELIKLYQERRELYKGAGRVRSLDQYNAATGASLPFVACFVDETSALLEHDGTKAPLIELARVGRKYGLGLILGGTDFKATTLPSEARSNCLARLAFWLEPGLSRSLLNSTAASDDTLSVGDIVAKRPGTAGTIRGHTPEVTQASYRRLARRRGDVLELQEITQPEASKSSGQGHPWTAEQAAEVLQRHAAGESVTAIAGSLWHPTTYYIERVRAIVAEHNQDGDQDDESAHVDDQHAGAVVDFCDFSGKVAGDIDDGRTFAACMRCGVAVCSECATGGLCPDCQEGG
ncbi:MAG: hypothetical protein GWN58_20330 [Anaerolineae bacterium]|nr:hypothetical protein [Anaerolineae bacterium]